MRLARELDKLKPEYDVVVVGSGYGAGVSAARFARMGLSVAVLERGREFQIGEFPDTVPEAINEFQYRHEGTRYGHRASLYDLHFGKHMHVLVGCGLGGTSLINANVSLPPDPRVWEDSCWPPELFDDDSLNQGFARATEMLRPTPYPNKVPLPKLDRMQEAAKRLDAELTLPPINVVFEETVNAAGVRQPACTLCGDCCSGCNVGAKTTVQMTYLPDAANHGAEIFTDATVRYLRKENGGWRLFYIVSSQRRDGFQSPEMSVAAKIVVLGAGSLGSTEILLRSRENGLALSERLGHGFTGNGDVLAFASNGQKEVNAVGVGVPPKSRISAPGPCIAGAIDLRGNDRLDHGMIIEEGVIPSGLSQVLPGIFNVGGVLFGKETSNGMLDEFQSSIRRAESWMLGAYAGAMNHTATFLVMAHDDGVGQLKYIDGGVELEWPDVAGQDVFKRIEARLLDVSAANNARYIRNPIQNTFLGQTLITVHPLGGCGIGADASRGVIDHKCRVFDTGPSAAPGAVHEGLYVIDGSSVPRPLGVNPLLTITALAERAMIHAARDLGRQLTVAPKPNTAVRELSGGAGQANFVNTLLQTMRGGVPMLDLSAGKVVEMAKSAALREADRVSAGLERAKSAVEAGVRTVTEANMRLGAPSETNDGRRPAGITFTERMAGFVSDRVNADYAAAATVGHSNDSTFSFVVTVRIDDIDRFLIDPMHEGRMTGLAYWKAVSNEPLDISNGVFRLMRRSTDAAETRLFEYEMTLTSRDKRSFTFRGQKNVHDDHKLGDLWADTTTLFIDVKENGGVGQAARGILNIAVSDFAKQIQTIQGIGGASFLERNNAIAKFGALFAGTLFDVYGNIFAPLKRYNPDRVRKKRGLRGGVPQVHFFQTADGKTLRLTRYNSDGQNSKGPLLFTHGLGVSSQIFTIDTIETNLLEYMCDRGWDCWLLDFRASIDLPYATERWTGDDCARFDYQPAVDLILRETHAPSVQVMAHCFGSTTFVMAMLGGHLTGVRSAVISQIAADVLVPFFPQRLLAFLRAPALFDLLKIDAVNARATTDEGFANRLMDTFIRLAVPFQREERSRNATSNRITALYGQLYEIAQLNAETFDTGLPEMFGPANIDAFKHLALIARKTVIVDATGEDAYMPHLDRLAFPLCFIHGAENACFKPESTARTMDKLIARNGARFYERHLIPNYGHIDCIFGKDAARDVYPKIHEHFEKSARSE